MKCFKNQSGLAGLAIILITMIVSMATLVVVNLTYSTFLSGRSVGMVERQLQAEYALKSLINVAVALLVSDVTPQLDAKEDVWAQFLSGAPVPPEIMSQLGFNANGMTVWLEIVPENSKISIDQLALQGATSSSAQQQIDDWKKIYAALFNKIGFDDQVQEPDHTGLFPNQIFDSKQLADNLETYTKTDNADKSSKMPSGNKKITRIGELINIPGFTPLRISVLTPYVTLYDNSRVNVNFASQNVLDALDPNINSSAIISYRESTGPIESVAQLQTIIDPQVAQNLAGRVSTESSWFQIIGKIEYGGGLTFFAKAIVSTQGNTKAEAKIESLLLY